MKSIPLRLLLAVGALALVPAARAQLNTTTGVVTGTNVSATSGAITNTLNGVTFSNLGLVGVGRIAATAIDAFGESLGSVSALQVSNWSDLGGGNYSGTFNFTPDRGYNGATFSNYAARIQAVDFAFTPYTGVATSGVPQNQFTTLSYNSAASAKFTYDSGGSNFVTTTGLVPDSSIAFGGASAVPYVTVSNGGGTNTTTGTTFPINRVSLDTEGLVLKADGSGYISDEYGPNIYHFNAAKQLDAVITPPAAIQPTVGGSPNFSSEVNGGSPDLGRRGNQGMEGLALSPDGTKLFGLEQSATMQDSGGSNQGRREARLLVYDVSSSATAPGAPVAEYVLQLPILNDNGVGSPNKTAAQSEVVALDSTHLLVLSREGNGKGTVTTLAPAFKSVLLVDLSTGSNIVGQFDATGGKIISSASGTGTPVLKAGVTPLSYTEAVNMLNTSQLGKFGLNLNGGTTATLDSISEKWEGLSLVPTGNPNEFFLFVANDNDFISGSTVMLGLDGSTLNAPVQVSGVSGGPPVQNDTMFLAYRVSITGLGASAIPEPSTYAALAGTGALLGAWLVRRRRAAR